ncbi:MAG: hypothetical protein EOO65_01145 [Methanosarcinales archaeon]|nr:MAG: hypothetical protein EOO65_01145 [Methanosarcinales archaeon]
MAHGGDAPKSSNARIDFMMPSSNMPSGWQESTNAWMSTVWEEVAALIKSKMFSIMYSYLQACAASHQVTI